MSTYDVAIVGGGIAGGAAGAALAGDELRVLVLEASEVYEDHVRGESLLPWGVDELNELGLYDEFVGAGAVIADTFILYAEGLSPEQARANAVPVGMMIPGVAGSLNIRHPAACQLLVDVAATRGADVRRGVRNVAIEPGPQPRVSFTIAGKRETASARLVIGADGRRSVIRKSAGIDLRRDEPLNIMAGLLVEDLDGVPTDHDFIAMEGDLFMAGFHQPEGRMRVYLCPSMAQRHRFSGRGGAARFLRSTAFECVPFATGIAAATPAGPLAGYTCEHTVASQPFSEGVVLIGDAAGYSNPIVAQGLASALRDVRMVRDVLRSGDWSAAAFEAWADERQRRSDRIRYVAEIVAAAGAEADDPDERARRRARLLAFQTGDARMMTVMASVFVGHQTAPPDAYDGSLLAEIRGEPPQ